MGEDLADELFDDASENWDDETLSSFAQASADVRDPSESIHRPLIILIVLVIIGGIIFNAFVNYTGGSDENGETDLNEQDSDWSLRFADSTDDLPDCDTETKGFLYYVASDEGFQSCIDSGWHFVGLGGIQGSQGGLGQNGTQGLHGANGTDGDDGVDGTDGQTPFFQSSSSSACPDGGTLVDIGYDSNGNGTLEPSEISMRVDICSGTTGSDGSDGTDGSNGIDGNDGQDGEQGSPGENGTDGQDGEQGPPGSTGPTGPPGADGTDGIDGQSGTNGNNALAVTSDESAGVNCANGGIKVEVGVDDNGDGTLQSSEVDHVQYVCDGGSTSNTMLTSVSSLYLSQCSSGVAHVVEHGLDNGDGGGTSANGQLEFGEVDFRTTYCINTLIIQLSSVSFGSGNSVGGVQWLTVVGSRVYFSAEGDEPPPAGNRGLELWTHDSSNNSTWRVTDINPGSAGSQIQSITAMSTRLYFAAYDGVTTGTSATGVELWAHETTNGSTWRVTDINSGSGHSGPSSITVMGTRLYFSAYDGGATGTELWAHETTNGSTWLAADIANPNDSYPAEITVMGTRLYFRANDGNSGHELWAHETTNDSTWQVADIRSGPMSGSPYSLTPIGTRLYFAANDGSTSSELWAHETTNDSTWRVTDINPGSGYSLNVDRFGIAGTRLYFSAWDGSSGYELWAHETINASTWRVADINSGSGSSNPMWLTTIGTKLYFSAKEGTGCGGGGGGPGGGCGIELMVHDMVNKSTWRVTDINVGTDDSEPQWLTVIGPRLFFGASDGTDNGLWGLITESTPAY